MQREPRIDYCLSLLIEAVTPQRTHTGRPRCITNKMQMRSSQVPNGGKADLLTSISHRKTIGRIQVVYVVIQMEGLLSCVLVGVV